MQAAEGGGKRLCKKGLCVPVSKCLEVKVPLLDAGKGTRGSEEGWPGRQGTRKVGEGCRKPGFWSVYAGAGGVGGSGRCWMPQPTTLQQRCSCL